MNPSSPAPLEFSVAIEMLGGMNIAVDPVMLSRIRHAACAGTLTILRNQNDDAVGFVCWAGGNKDSVRIADRFGLFPRYFWEFKEGNILLVILVCFAYPFSQEATRSFRSLLRAHRAIYYMRRGRKQLLLRTSKGFKAASVT